ncbi:MAG: O-antigen ligase family protein [Weeksellaceae bacterium]|nr:O-antigen ligase family protein [Weeksellaceae bacterium]
MKLLGNNKFFEFSLVFFAFTLSMWNNINTLAVYPIIISWRLLNNWKEKARLLQQNLTAFVLMTALFLLFLSNFLFQEDKTKAAKLVIKASPLLLFPLILFSTSVKSYKTSNIFSALISGTIVTILICWFRIIWDILSKRDPIDQAGYFFEWIYTDFNLLKPFNTHPSYVGVLVVLCIIILMKHKGFEEFRKEKVLYYSLLLIQTFFILQTNSRISLLCLLLFLTVHFISKFSRKSILQYVSVLVVFAFSILKFDYLNSKLMAIFSPEGDVILDRYPRWLSILRENELLGNFWIGSGKEKAQYIYNEAYFKYGFGQALSEQYNAHNQYLDFFVSNGVIGLFVFVAILVYFFLNTRRNLIAQSFILIFSLFAITESFFGRSAGLLMFGFLYSMMFMNFKKQIQ